MRLPILIRPYAGIYGGNRSKNEFTLVLNDGCAEIKYKRWDMGLWLGWTQDV